MKKRMLFSFILLFLSISIICADEKILQNGVGGYMGCEDQLLIMDTRTEGYMPGYGNPSQATVPLCYFKC